MTGKGSAGSKASHPWWRRLLGIVLFVVLALVVLNPQFAFMGFLLDGSVIDLVILLLGVQVLLFRDQIWMHLVSAHAAVTRRLRSWKSRDGG